MDQLYFIGGITLFVSLAILWGFRVLPKENWQIMAVLPRQKTGNGKWKGLNLTYYGLLSANAYTFAVVIFIVLTASAGIPLVGLCLLVTGLLLACIPSSKIIARMVEKKTGTLTVGGAVFTGTILAPFLVLLVNHLPGSIVGFKVSPIIFLSAASVAYAFGEGLGRLACVSFGCCYGKPVHQCSPFFQRLFSGFYLVFSGKTKKIAYASGLDEERVIPIQIITSIIYSITGVTGTLFFLRGHYVAALMVSLIITQVWRFVSEFFRADFRGTLKVTPYQMMSLGTILYAAGMAVVFPIPPFSPVLARGLGALWNPWIILLVEVLWFIAFFHTGKSVVTRAEVSFHVVETKI